MNLFSKLFRSRDKPQNHLGGLSFLFGQMAAGKAVNERTAMQTTAVYACVRILAESIACLPLAVYCCSEAGKEIAYERPLYFLLYDAPNSEMTSFIFRETMMSHLLLWGNACAQILCDGRGKVLGLYPLLLDKMEVSRDSRKANSTTHTREVRRRIQTSRIRDRFVCGVKMSSTFPVSASTVLSATRPSLGQRSPSASRLQRRNTVGHSSRTVRVLARFWNIPVS